MSIIMAQYWTWLLLTAPDGMLWGLTICQLCQDLAGATMMEMRAARTWRGAWARGTTAARTTITTASGWQARLVKVPDLPSGAELAGLGPVRAPDAHRSQVHGVHRMLLSSSARECF